MNGLFEETISPPKSITRSAEFSADRRFRHQLFRSWDSSKPTLPFILCNPSDADEKADDPTVKKGIGFAWRLGYGSMVFANLWDFIATNPLQLKRAGYPMSPDNDRSIIDAAHMGRGIVICAWGANARGLARPGEVLQLLRKFRFEPNALQLTADGIPQHILMLPYHLKPVPLR